MNRWFLAGVAVGAIAATLGTWGWVLYGGFLGVEDR